MNAVIVVELQEVVMPPIVMNHVFGRIAAADSIIANRTIILAFLIDIVAATETLTLPESDGMVNIFGFVAY